MGLSGKMCGAMGAALLWSTCAVKGCDARARGISYLVLRVCAQENYLSCPALPFCKAALRGLSRVEEGAARQLIRVQVYSRAPCAKPPRKPAVLCGFQLSAPSLCAFLLHWNRPGLQAGELCGRDSVSEGCAKIYCGPDLAQSLRCQSNVKVCKVSNNNS